MGTNLIRTMTGFLLIFFMALNFTINAERVSEMEGCAFTPKSLTCLDNAIKLAKSIQDEDQRTSIVNQLQSNKECIQKSIQSNDLKGASESCYCLYENYGEIVSECSDVNLRKKIADCLCEMIKE